jgi:hypothetical protein
LNTIKCHRKQGKIQIKYKKNITMHPDVVITKTDKSETQLVGEKLKVKTVIKPRVIKGRTS